MHLRLPLFLILALLQINVYALRVDSIQISHTELHLKVRDFSAKRISGLAIHRIHYKMATDFLTLDLKSLRTDSVKIGSKVLVFSHNGEKLKVSLDKTYQFGDSSDLEVYYSGSPAADPSGWGGFYFSGDFAFNLGVGFQVFPHSFGRAWMPCVDEFEMKTAYDMFIETDSAYTAACNGLLIGVQSLGDSRIWHYREKVPISAYLAAVSVSRFAVVRGTFNGMQQKFPLELFCKSGDTNKVKASFVNLPNAINEFEKAFGPQPFSKVGYNMVPFTAGAMEHAGNITYPSIYADGSKNYETLMAHELSHHWWGDQVTCRTEADMWLNEGWASYCEHFFLEKLYGQTKYMEEVNANHLEVMRYAHIVDGGNFALNAIPSNITYGRHVYKKGADVIHSLRNMLGDTVFFNACKQYQIQYRLKNANSAEMKAVFVANGGGEAADCFFENFIFTQGSPHFIIEKQIHSGSNPHHLKVITYQKPRFNEVPCAYLPLEIFFFKDHNNWVKKTIVLKKTRDTFEFDLDFKAQYVCLDKDQKLTDAITDANLSIDSTRVYDVPEAFAKLTVKKMSNPAFLRVEHHWTGPEVFETQSPFKSKYRYITVDGVSDDSFQMDLELTYDGRQGSTQGTGYLDHTLIFITEDSLKLMYRAYPGAPWVNVDNAAFTKGNKMDKQGKVLVPNARKGDYVFAMADKNLDLKKTGNRSNQFRIVPNPGSNQIKLMPLEFSQNMKKLDVSVMSMNGELVMSLESASAQEEVKLDTSSLAEGVYLLQIICYNADGSHISEVQRLLIRKN